MKDKMPLWLAAGMCCFILGFVAANIVEEDRPNYCPTVEKVICPEIQEVDCFDETVEDYIDWKNREDALKVLVRYND